MNSHIRAIGWIGLGNMGRPMARRLIAAGYKLYLNDINRENAEELINIGAWFFENPAEVMDSCSTIFTMLPTRASLMDVVCGSNGLIKKTSQDSLIVDMSTMDAQTSSFVAEAIEKKQGSFLRATVTGSVAYAENGQLGFLVSGDHKQYIDIKPVLEILGNKFWYLGEKEEARYMKIIINMIIYNIMQLLSESLMLGETMGLDWDTMVDLICESAAGAPIFNYKKDAIKNRDYSPTSTTKICVKDMGFAVELAKKANVNVPVTNIVAKMFEDMAKQSYGDKDFSSIIHYNEVLNNIKGG
jgi:3-hydroxyisobutyrate dehydrogenase-like beta-hydroxyacid dehydrogenase